jgi:inhibitor of cysteine peptidase
MKIRVAAILVMVGILISAIAGCSSAGAAANVPRNTHKSIEIGVDELAQNKQIVRSLEMNKGDTLTLTLGSNPTTGFSWTEQTLIGDEAIIEQTRHEFLQPSTDALGAAGQQVWTFNALKAGATQIHTDYSRPWTGGEKGEWTFTLNVTVK